MDEECVSVIVPVYNVEQYLEKCVYSIVNQTYKNLEIILVDDGSKDDSGKICDKCATADERISVIHKTNGGLSDARNCGIERATGKWITFIDSDDYISEYYVDELLNVVKKQNADISICDPVHVFNDMKATFEKNTSITCFSSLEAVKTIWYQSSFLPSAWGKMYKRALFDDVRFTCRVIYEDIDIMHKIFCRAKKIVYINSKMYAYVHRENSITTQGFSEQQFYILEICDKIRDFAFEHTEDVQKAARAYSIAGNMRIYICTPRIKQYVKVIDDCKSYIQKNTWIVLKDLKIRWKMKIGLLLFLVNKRLFVYVHSRINRWR
jgi:glycosyltransferase involved in cell wall biosynthesis